MDEMRRRGRHWSIGVGQIGFSLTLIGLGLLYSAFFRPTQDGLYSLIEETQTASYDELLRLSSGEVRLIEAKISSENQPLVDGLVAYQHWHGTPDIREDMIWVVEEFVTPELALEMDSRRVTVEPGYSLFGEMPQVINGLERYDGVAVGDTILVIGPVLNNDAGIKIQAEYLIHGSLEENQPPRFDLYPLGGGVALLFLGLGIMGWLLRRGYRPFGNPKTGR